MWKCPPLSWLWLKSEMTFMKTKANGQSATDIYTLEMRDTAVEVTTSAEQIGDIAGEVTRGVDAMALAGWRVQQRE